MFLATGCADGTLPHFPARPRRARRPRRPAGAAPVTRATLYPDIEPRRSGRLAVSDLHRLYWEEVGNPDGVPALFLHGGPGSGLARAHRRFFDPQAWRLVLFDQRGAGRSTPPAETRENTTAHLVADIEALRRHLGIERWLLFGGSWGSTLALAYGQAHPGRCLAFVLRGVFLGRPEEIAWFLDGMGAFFPEAARAFREHLPAAERGDPLAGYLRRLNDPDPAVHGPAARAWSAYEAACSTLRPEEPGEARLPAPAAALALARLEAHYFAHGMFLAPNALLDGMPRIADKPAVIAQGRYDAICPIRTADELARAWPGAEYTVAPDAGHSAMEPGLRAALVRATERFKRELAPPRRTGP